MASSIGQALEYCTRQRRPSSYLALERWATIAAARPLREFVAVDEIVAAGPNFVAEKRG
jgi:hypothetical protein